MAVRTHEVSVDGRVESFTKDKDTEPLLPDGVELVGTPQLSVRVTIDEELVSRKVQGVPLALRGVADTSKWELGTAQVEVTLTGALLAVEKAKASMKVFVKLAPGETKAREVPVSIEEVPPGIGVRISPEHVQVAPVLPRPRE